MAQPIKFELPKIGSGSTLNGLNGEMDAYIGMATIAAQGIHHTEIAKYIMTACNAHESLKAEVKALREALTKSEKYLECTCADAPGMCAGNCARFQARRALSLSQVKP